MRQQHHPRATFNREEMTVGEIAAILHHDDAEVQAAGCLAMSQQVKDHVGATSLWPPSLAVAALRDYPSDKQAQSYGIEMLGNVAYYYPIEQTHLVDAGAVSLIITALRQHPDDVDVQRNGCKALAYLLDMDFDDDGNWTDIPFLSDSQVKVPVFRAIATADAAPLLEVAQARFSDNEDLQKVAPVLLGVLRSDETEVLEVIDSIVDAVCLANETEAALKQQLDEALAAGRYDDVSVFAARIAALQKPDGGPAVGQQTKPLFAALQKPDGGPAVGQQTKPLLACSNPDGYEYCLRAPHDKSRRKIWKKHFCHHRMMQELTPAELKYVVKRNNQPPEELHQELKSTARYVMEKALCMATNTATVKLTADVLCPNCFQHYIAKTLSE
jgi:hypothetical protein